MGKPRALTDKAVAAYAADPRKRLEVPVHGCAGLYLAIQPTGAKSWVVRYRSPIKRDGAGQRAPAKLTLGTVAALSVKQAEKAAKDALWEVARNIDPAATKRATRAHAKDEAIQARDNTVDAVMVEFLKRYRGKKRQGLRESTRLLTAHYFGFKPDPDNAGQWKKTGNGVLAAWSGRPIASITKQDARTLLNALVDAGHGVTANRTLTVLKTLFAWAVKHDLLTISPVAMLDALAQEKSREVVLTDAEIKAMWTAANADGYPFGKLVQLLLLTGARRDELRNAPWSEFDLDARTWLLPAERSKNGREHLVPLAPMTIEILRSLPRIGSGKLLFTTTGETPVSGMSKALDRLRGTADWSPHDLRRTFYSGLQALKFPIEVAEACTNHKSGTLRGVAKVYARHQYLAEKTAAFEAWARHVDSLVNGVTGGNVVSIMAGAKQ